MLRKTKIVAILILTVLLISCSKDSFYDFLLGEQPTFIGDHKFVPGLNVFALLRPDSINSIPLSFVHVEKAIPAISNETDSLIVTNAKVVIYKMQNNSIVDSTLFSYTESNEAFKLPEYRPVRFNPSAGEHYKIICQAAGLPELTSETTIPLIPQLEGDTVITSVNKVKFSIIKDTTSSMYDIYYYTEDGDFKMIRKIPSETGNTQVEIQLEGEAKRLVIYSYDKKMASYFSASNLSFKPNTFRPPFTNVQGGYGSFGAMNIYEKGFN